MKNSGKIPIFQQICYNSAVCQACLSKQIQQKDCIATCQVCKGSIHQMHYGSQLLLGIPQKWVCQRCQVLLQNKGQIQIKCEFCPSLKGIMKRFTFQKKQNIWLHLECATWGYPLIYFTSKKREGIMRQSNKTPFYDFWVRQYTNPICEICKQDYGMHIKCKYYDCVKHYHVTCARIQGIVRDLQSMKIENTNTYIPIYCKEHLQKRMADFKTKAKLMNTKNQFDKVSHFNKLSNIFTIQLKNMNDSVKKYADEQQLRNNLIQQKQIIMKQKDSDFVISQDCNSFKSFHSQGLLQFLDKQLGSEKISQNYMEEQIQVSQPENVAAQSYQMKQINQQQNQYKIVEEDAQLENI